jgi:hypothetical protein
VVQVRDLARARRYSRDRRRIMKFIVTNSVAQERIKLLQPFRNTTSSLWAYPGPAASLGKLPPEYHDAADQATYVVYSYLTPIAWVNPGNGSKTLPDVGYSLTTSQHQYIVSRAWGVDLPVKRGREVRPAGTGTRPGYFGRGV